MRTDGPDHDAGDLPDWAAGLRVPDDARELEWDLEVWRREQRRTRVRSLRRRRPIAFAAGVCVISMLGATAAGLIATLLPSTPDAVRHPATLATAPGRAPGVVGGLLPDVTLRLGGGPVHARTIRPAVFALLPVPCGCGALVDSLAAQAQEFGVPLVLVPAGDDDGTEASALARDAHRGRVVTAYDESTALADAFDPAGVTALVVADDGVVAAVARDLSLPLRLEPALTRAYLSGTSSAAAMASK